MNFKKLTMAAMIVTGLNADNAMCNLAMQDSAKQSDYTRLYYRSGDMLNASVHASLTRSAVIRFQIECKRSKLTKRQYVQGVKAGKEVVQHFRELGLLR